MGTQRQYWHIGRAISNIRIKKREKRIASSRIREFKMWREPDRPEIGKAGEIGYRESKRHIIEPLNNGG